jgi:hypothetical protein
LRGLEQVFWATIGVFLFHALQVLEERKEGEKREKEEREKRKKRKEREKREKPIEKSEPQGISCTVWN